MKKKSDKRKKYTVGGKVNSYIETPSDMLAENQIMIAQAQLQAATDPLVVGLQSLSGLMGMAGNSMMSMGKGGGGGGGSTSSLSDSLSAGDVASDILDIDSGGIFQAKYGGKVPVEVEGGEVAETPSGQLLDFKGPSHKEGGINTSLPPGTDIFSETIKIGGKSLAEIKKKKSRDVNKYSKDTDGIAKNSRERAVKAEAVFDAMSNTLSSIFSVLEKQDNLNNVRKKYGLGGSVLGPNPEEEIKIEDDLLSKELFPSLNLNNYFSDILKPSQAHTPGTVDMKTSSAQQINYEQQIRNIQNQKPGAVSNKSSRVGTSAGDLLGVAGNIYQGVAPYLNTLRGRAGDSPNVNEYKGFGEDALKTNLDAQQYAQTSLDNYLQDIELSTKSARSNARGSARGVNTMRALDIATEGNKQKATRAAYNDNANTMMSLLSQRSQLQNQRDEVVMRGEGAKNLADIQDRDFYLSNLGQNEVAIGKTIASLGKYLNQSKERDVMATLMNSMFEHTGMNFGSGEMVGKETEASMAAKNDISKTKQANAIASKSWKTATDNPFSKDGKYNSLAEYKKIKGIV